MGGILLIVGPPIMLAFALWKVLVRFALPRYGEEEAQRRVKPMGTVYKTKDGYVVPPNWLDWACYAVSGVAWFLLVTSDWFSEHDSSSALLVAFAAALIAFLSSLSLTE